MTTYKNVTNADLEFQTDSGKDLKFTSGNDVLISATDLSISGTTKIVGTLESTAATSLATSSGAVTIGSGGGDVTIGSGGGDVDIGSTSVATTIKGTLNVDEAATFDTTVGITGDLTVDGGDIVASNSNIGNAINIFATTTGKTTLGGGAVDISASSSMTTVKGTLNVDKAVTLDSTLSVGNDLLVGTANLFVDTQNSGNVGIGTVAPKAALDIKGSRPQGPSTSGIYMGKTGDNTYGYGIEIANDVSSDGPYSTIDFTSSSDNNFQARIGHHSSYPLFFQVGSDGTIDMQINSGGDILLHNDLSVEGTSYLKGDVTLAGSLTVNGTTTTVNTSTVEVEDPILYLASQNSGTTTDIGFIGKQSGANNNIGLIWDSNEGEFSTIKTAHTTNDSNGVTITDYANLHTGQLLVEDALSVEGITRLSSTLSVAGDITSVNEIRSKNAGGWTAGLITDGSYPYLWLSAADSRNSGNDFYIRKENSKGDTFFYNGGSAFGQWYMKANGDSNWGTSSGVRMTLKADGKLGIGTETPGESLEVSGKVKCEVEAMPTGEGKVYSLVGHDGTGASYTFKTVNSGYARINNTISGSPLLEMSRIHSHGTFDAEGATELWNTLSVAGATRIDDTLSVSGATTIENTLSVSGATRIANTLSVAGAITSHGQIKTQNSSGGYSAGLSTDGSYPYLWLSTDATLQTGNDFYIRKEGVNGDALFYNAGTSVAAWYMKANGDSKWGTYGSPKMTLKYDTGRLGIGTESPGALLDVNGTTKLRNTLSISGATSVDSTLSVGSTMKCSEIATNTTYSIKLPTSAPTANNTKYLRATTDSSGVWGTDWADLSSANWNTSTSTSDFYTGTKVGIGTTDKTPSGQLEVYSTASVTQPNSTGNIAHFHANKSVWDPDTYTGISIGASVARWVIASEYDGSDWNLTFKDHNEDTKLKISGSGGIGDELILPKKTTTPNGDSISPSNGWNAAPLRFRNGGLNNNSTSTPYEWNITQATSADLYFYYNNGGDSGGNGGYGAARAYLNYTVDVSALDFTGQHRAITNNTKIMDNINNYIGLIVSSTGKITSRILNKDNNNFNMKSNKEAITINESIPEVNLSNKRNDKKCFGIISNSENKNSNDTEYTSGALVTVIQTDNDDTRLYINSVGEGAIWVSNINGNIENGDYITTSDIAGYGMKQDDDLLHNYTVAKATMDCTFDNTQTDKYETKLVKKEDGTEYIAAFIACTYHCG